MEMAPSQFRRLYGRRVPRDYIKELLRTAEAFSVEKGKPKDGLYDARAGTIQIWCRPGDKPKCWDAPITPGSFGRAELVGDLTWNIQENLVSAHPVKVEVGADLALEAYCDTLIQFRRKRLRLEAGWPVRQTKQETGLSIKEWVEIWEWLADKASELLRLTDLVL